MSKNKVDDVKKIETSFLRKHRYFTGRGSGCGTITWTRDTWGGEHKSSVGIEVSVSGDEGYLRIHYTQTENDTGEKKDFDYKIPLTTTPCRYGGKRYWFTCPWYKSGVYCGRRVGTLYKDGDYFACRHCYNLTYESRNLSGFSKGFGSIVSIPELEKLEAKVKRQYYRGKPTKAYQRFLNKDAKATRGMVGMLSRLESRFNKGSNAKK